MFSPLSTAASRRRWKKHLRRTKDPRASAQSLPLFWSRLDRACMKTLASRSWWMISQPVIRPDFRDVTCPHSAWPSTPEGLYAVSRSESIVSCSNLPWGCARRELRREKCGRILSSFGRRVGPTVFELPAKGYGWGDTACDHQLAAWTRTRWSRLGVTREWSNNSTLEGAQFEKVPLNASMAPRLSPAQLLFYIIEHYKK